MFTGLVESVGTVLSSDPDRDSVGRRLDVAAFFAAKLDLGESVAINGTCLTVVQRNPHGFSVQISPTTLALTTLGELQRDDRVNLERSVTAATRLGGHWVLGHVDTRGTVHAIVRVGDNHHITIRYPADYDRWVLPQGSVTLDGVSLTVLDPSPGQLTVTIIPHTWSHTIIQDWHVGTSVNMEFDVLGKYVEHLLAPHRISEEE